MMMVMVIVMVIVMVMMMVMVKDRSCVRCFHLTQLFFGGDQIDRLDNINKYVFKYLLLTSETFCIATKLLEVRRRL